MTLRFFFVFFLAFISPGKGPRPTENGSATHFSVPTHPEPVWMFGLLLSLCLQVHLQLQSLWWSCSSSAPVLGSGIENRESIGTGTGVSILP